MAPDETVFDHLSGSSKEKQPQQAKDGPTRGASGEAASPECTFKVCE